nr:uncharacterized protein LOC129455971 [Misgurnus anguillicaudatus]
MEDRASTRPKRRTYPPRHYEAYEMGYVLPQRQSSESRISRHGLEDDLYSHKEAAAEITRFPGHQPLIDVSYEEEDTYAETKQSKYRPVPKSQLYDQCPEVIPTERSRDFTPQIWSTTERRLPPAIHTDLMGSKEDDLSAALTELREARSELKLLTETLRSLKQTTPPDTTRYTSSAYDSRAPVQFSISPLDYGCVPPPSAEFISGEEAGEEDEVDWPDPPPWPDQEGSETRPQPTEPVVTILERMMSELEVLKQAANCQKRPTTALPDSHPVRDSYAGRVLLGHSSQQRSLYPQTPLRPSSVHNSEQYESFLQGVHATTSQPYLPRAHPRTSTDIRHQIASPSESTYRGPMPTIPYFSRRDPSEFARLKISLCNLLPSNGTELFKYQILVDHLKLEEARLIADSYLNSPTPYSDTMAALNQKFGQPHQMVLNKIASVMDSPDIRRGDQAAFEKFALQIQALVGMLKSLGPTGEIELQCGSHVARLLSKLPTEMRAEFRRSKLHLPGTTYTLSDLSDWLQYESWCQEYDGSSQGRITKEKQGTRNEPRQKRWTATVLHGSREAMVTEVSPARVNPTSKNTVKTYCPFCTNSDHFLSQCTEVVKLNRDQLSEWIRTNRRCWRCARAHLSSQCNLRKPCSICQGKHLSVLHEVNYRTPKAEVKSTKEESCLVNTPSEVLYVDRPVDGSRVLLKVIKVLLRHGKRTLDTYAILDDGSERTMLLPAAARYLGLQGEPEDLALRTIRQDIQVLNGSMVSFRISSADKPQHSFLITGAFTAERLGLALHSYPIDKLQRKYKHLVGLPIQGFEQAQPLLLIGADHPHLITPIKPVRLGPPGGPAALKTRLGWTLQGPTRLVEQSIHAQQCLLTFTIPQVSELFRNVEKLWQVDVLPLRNEKEVTRSRQDQEALHILETKTTRVEVDGVLRYATPLLRRKDIPRFEAPKEMVMPSLRNTERSLSKDPERAKAYNAEIQKLVQAGTVKKLSPQVVTQPGESWYIPHHMVTHNNKNRIVFNCSYRYRGLNLNEWLLPGPTLGPSLLGVLLRFREHAVAISGDVKAMFHQVRLLSEDRSLLRFVWRDMEVDRTPSVFEWQVLPFGTTCSPCCATYAMQHHVISHSQPEDNVRFSIERCFYVDNCLQSLSSPDQAKTLVDKLRKTLASGGFELRQWASNRPEVINHLPEEARSENLELWLSHNREDNAESALGLSWHCSTDTMRYKHRPVKYDTPTMRNIYKVLASQYDPLGFILPYTTRAKILVRQLWDKHRDWDDPLLPHDLLQAWRDWEAELQVLPRITFPRAYLPPAMDEKSCTRDMHVFCDASEQAYGAVVYLRTTDSQGQPYLSFVAARSRIAPKRLLSIPRLELCAAHTGAQLTRLLKQELTLPISKTILWTDSTTVLSWLHSESCRFKVFVGTRVAEIQELTDRFAWRYVDSANNPADDLTRGKKLKELVGGNRWSHGPPFLLQSPDNWPTLPSQAADECHSELRKSVFCGVTTIIPDNDPHIPDALQYTTWRELVEATVQMLNGAASQSKTPNADDYRNAEILILKGAQQNSFPEELKLLQNEKPVQRSSRLLKLSPELDKVTGLIRVGGRLRQAEDLDLSTVHPVILDQRHPTTKLLIKDYDSQLCHPGPERVFAEIRRKFWILRGREAIRRYQHTCSDCRRWKASPQVPKMADLPRARLRLYNPAFYSTGMDCFGHFQVKVGRRTEKRWGIIFKCLTTRCVHLEILTNLDTDSFLMALRRFIARRGTPAQLFSDQGTNFRGGEREIREAFAALSPDLQLQLAKQKIEFHFNPPSAPHFGGVWEREIRSVKTALYRIVGTQAVTEEVLHTVLLEVEGMLNSKPLGYVSSDPSDLDPVTPNVLLMGRRDGSLPQVVYPKSELLSRRRWRHSQILADQFWSSFIKNYLPSMQSRQKWHATPEDICPGSVVLMMDSQLPRACWPIGQVTKVYPSADGYVRTVEVMINKKLYIRPVAKLIVLKEIPDEAEN